uniref:Uncharacterized protein n=1 Tax=Opuntia streptacantha TaxID=393608 RepID=A0A7C9EIH5_OPUST
MLAKSHSKQRNPPEVCCFRRGCSEPIDLPRRALASGAQYGGPEELGRINFDGGVRITRVPPSVSPRAQVWVSWGPGGGCLSHMSDLQHIRDEKVGGRSRMYSFTNQYARGQDECC